MFLKLNISTTDRPLEKLLAFIYKKEIQTLMHSKDMLENESGLINI